MACQVDRPMWTTLTLIPQAQTLHAGHQVSERAGVPRQHREAVRLRARDVGRERRDGGASFFSVTLDHSVE